MYEPLCWILLIDFYWSVTWTWNLGFRLTWICFWGSNNKATWELDFQCQPLGFLVGDCSWQTLSLVSFGTENLTRLRAGQDTGSPVLRHQQRYSSSLLKLVNLHYYGLAFFSRWLRIGSPRSLLTHPIVSFQLFPKRQNSIGIGHEDVFSLSQKPMLNFGLSLNIF